MNRKVPGKGSSADEWKDYRRGLNPHWITQIFNWYKKPNKNKGDKK